MANRAWKLETSAGRWQGFGPYYAMFPVDFARWVVETMSSKNGAVLDPFCGRGTAAFVAQVTGRSSLGIDINPVAWVFSSVKTSPEPNTENLFKRLQDINNSISQSDKKAKNEFQKWAWSADVLGFLNASRRILDWRENVVDRTVMGFILVHVHAKIGDGISNQMQKARAMGPDYAVRWWKERGMRPPEIDPSSYIRNRINWRYSRGIIEQIQPAKIVLGDSTKLLSNYRGGKFDLLFTSPPYFNVTDYRQDSWIRLWMLNEGPPLPDWKKDKTNIRRDLYQQMMFDVISSASKLLKSHNAVWIRTDTRLFARNTTQNVLRTVWPKRKLYISCDNHEIRTQTSHFGYISAKSREVDFLMPGRKPLPNSKFKWKEVNT